MRHMVSLLDLEWDELLVYHQLYLRSDFSTGITEYTDRQIEESLYKAKVGRTRIRTILKKFVRDGLFIEISKGKRGNNSAPAIGKLIKIKDIEKTLYKPNIAPNQTLEGIENSNIKGNCEPNANLNQTLFNPLIKEKGIKNSIHSRIITRLNELTNKKYKSTTKKTIAYINARLNENFTEDDFYKVIETKSKEWLGTKMEIYLRPETLFGTKFEGYLNQNKDKQIRDKSNTNINRNIKADSVEDAIKLIRGEIDGR